MKGSKSTVDIGGGLEQCREATLWEAVRRCHDRTSYDRLGDDPEARRALSEWETAFVGMERKAPCSATVKSFAGERK
jgi:hypothetical protein